MAKKHTTYISQLKKTEEKINSLVSRGYMPLLDIDVSEIKSTDSVPSLSEMCGSHTEKNGNGFSRMLAGNTSLFNFEGDKQALPVSGGTENLGYVPWGRGDQLPNNVYNFANSLPYTAAALEYLTNLTFGLGPRLVYHYAKYANGTLKVEDIDYEDAGELLLGRIGELYAKIEERNREKEESMSSSIVKDGIMLFAQKQSTAEPSEDEPVLGSLDYQLNRLIKDYEAWQKTNAEQKEFHERNDLSLHALKCIQDDCYLDICFPTYGLSKGIKGRWEPKVVTVGHLPAACCRFEQMDENHRINYLYYSEAWRSGITTANQHETLKNAAVWPVLRPSTFASDLKDLVARNRSKSPNDRETWVVAPRYYPDMLHPYYPRPKWYSLFSSLVIQYASTLIYDKAIARQNATMWGKIIYINIEYLEQIYKAKGAETKEEKASIRAQIKQSVNDFLRRRENNGKTITLDMYPSQDEKQMIKSVEIVDIPTKNNEALSKDELEELSSIIFFTMGIHPSLIGATPGKSGSTGGTYQRELHLIKQTQVIPRQDPLLQFYNNIIAINKWDSHARYIFKMPVLTTLDRSKTGIDTFTNQ